MIAITIVQTSDVTYEARDYHGRFKPLLIVYHPKREQPYTIWTGEQEVIGFFKSWDHVERFCDRYSPYKL